MKVSIVFAMAFLMLNCSVNQGGDVAFEVDSDGNFVKEVAALSGPEAPKTADKDEVEVSAPTSAAFSGHIITKDMHIATKTGLEKVTALSVKATFNPQAQLRVQSERAQWEAAK